MTVSRRCVQRAKQVLNLTRRCQCTTRLVKTELPSAVVKIRPVGRWGYAKLGPYWQFVPFKPGQTRNDGVKILDRCGAECEGAVLAALPGIEQILLDRCQSLHRQPTSSRKP